MAAPGSGLFNLWARPRIPSTANTREKHTTAMTRMNVIGLLDMAVSSHSSMGRGCGPILRLDVSLATNINLEKPRRLEKLVVVRRLMSLVIRSAAVAVLGIIACGQEPTQLPPTVVPTVAAAAAATTTPVAVPDTPSPTEPFSNATPQPTRTTAPPPRPTPTSPPPPPPTTEPAATPTPPLPLDLLSPRDGSILEVSAVRVLGNTQIGAVATINGAPVEIEADGSILRDLALEVGLNTINVVVTDRLGQAESQNVAVFVVPTAAPLPFNVFYPRDGIEVRQRDLPVLGVTKPDAVVAVNGVPMEVNALGIYSGILTLEDDANLVEVLATDIDGNVRFETIVVFYTP